MYLRRNNTQKNTKTQNPQNRKQNIQNKKVNVKRMIKQKPSTQNITKNKRRKENNSDTTFYTETH